MTAQTALQERIDAQQLLDAVVYAQRALSETKYLAPAWAARQWRAGRAAAQQLGVAVVYDPCYGQVEARQQLAAAKAAATERLAAAKAELKSIGNVRQLRLALAEEGEAHTFSLAA